MTIPKDVWIICRLGGLGALGLAGVLWIIYMAIAPATERELETVSGTVVNHWINRRKNSIMSQTLTIRQSDGDEARYTIPYTTRGPDGAYPKINIERGTTVTLRVTEAGYVYAAEVRGRTLLDYEAGRAWHSTRRLFPGILATTASLLALVLALLSYFGPRLQIEFSRDERSANRRKASG